ncbi:16S rRNA (cytosine(967)-C(5))-methyltransferase RsmB [Lentilactobacillus sp. Marseille-Q4993]|uniref:16S rRNA (cytosine(967)-C(5))-methyltransferase RsmB n=1 Tax=Lentilactobacillus sp. Marseille-Q4993 TaxID=3039492 RepID=UPI0024BC8B43|nr:16S rRNA (cytosine(967)-C(5))-methyltransferase RsmB [Lentilactobacillus sp. Marseille-Q4993]
MKITSNNPRKLAVDTLVEGKQGAYSNIQVNNVLSNTDMKASDGALYTTIVYGVIQHRLTLEYQLRPFLRDESKTDEWVKELLYTAIFQMHYLDRIPTRAIFDETIKIAKTKGHDGIRRMVTGILHAIQKKGLPSFDKIKDPTERLSVEFSVPVWLVEKLTSQLGSEKTLSILESINSAPKQSIRVNQNKISKEELTAKLEDEGFTVTPSAEAASALIISDGHPVHSQLFKDGYYTIQDESAMLPVESMTLHPDDTVLDACSAPGGKTTQILEHVTNGQVIALDIHDKKLQTVNRNAKRMGLNGSLETIALDARKVDEKFADGYFDSILVDAPCTGLGLIRKKPEIRYGKLPEDIEHLSKIQLEILNAVAKKLKPSGTITYSTCTIVDEENIGVVNRFLTDNPDFELQPTKTKLGLTSNIDNGLIKIYPDDFESDGFFVATLKRVK